MPRPKPWAAPVTSATLPAKRPGAAAEGRGVLAVGLHLPVLDEAALLVAQGAHAAERIGALVDAQAVEVDVAGGVDLLPRVASGEDAQARARP